MRYFVAWSSSAKGVNISGYLILPRNSRLHFLTHTDTSWPTFEAQNLFVVHLPVDRPSHLLFLISINIDTPPATCLESKSTSPDSAWGQSFLSLIQTITMLLLTSTNFISPKLYFCFQIWWKLTNMIDISFGRVKSKKSQPRKSGEEKSWKVLKSPGKHGNKSSAVPFI